MPAFSLARLQEDLDGGRLSADGVADYMAVFAEFGTGQLRHLAGRLGLPDPADRAAALADLEGKLAACMSGAFPVAAGGLTTDSAGVTATPAEKEAAKGTEGVEGVEGTEGVDGKAGVEPTDPDAKPGTSYCGAAYESPGSVPAKMPKTSYASPGSYDGTEGMPLWKNEGGASPGKGGKASQEPAPAHAPAADAGAVAEPLPECPGCPKKDPAAMAVDIGGDGDDDGGPLTAEHVLAECAANGITDRLAAQSMAAFVVKTPGATHAQVHAIYDLVRALTAGGNMKQPAAVEKAIALGSVDGLRRAAANGDTEAIQVVSRMPAEFSEGYWSGVVLSAGRPRTRLAVFAEFAGAGVPNAYTAAYLAGAAPHDPAGEWLSLVGAGGTVRVRVGRDGTVTGGPAGLFGRDSATALAPAHRPAAAAARERAKTAALTAGFAADRPAAGPPAAPNAPRVAPTPKTAGGLLGKLHRGVTGGKAVFSAAPATTGLYAALQSIPASAKARGGAVARFAAVAAAATPAGLDPQYYWDELVRCERGRATRLALLADRLDAGFSEAGAVEAAGRAEFVFKTLAKAAVGTAKAVGKAAVGTAKAAGKAAGHIDRKLGKIGGGGDHGHGDHGGGHAGGGSGGGDADGDCHWMTISGAMGTTHICVNEEGHITKGPDGLAGRPANEALNDHHHEMIETAKQKAKEKREKRSAGESGGDKTDPKAGGASGKGEPGKPGASHGDTTHAAHAAGHKVSSAAEHIETAVHFLLHPGAAAAGVAASKVLGARVGALKKRIHRSEERIRQRYGAKVGTAILCSGVAGSFAGGMAVPGIGHILVPATPGMHLVGALPAMAVAEVIMAGGAAVKLGGRALAAGLDKMKKAAGLLKRFLTGGGKSAESKAAAPAPDGPKSKRQERFLERATARKEKEKAEMSALFAWSDLYWAAWPGEAALFADGEVDPNDPHLDVSAEEIKREGKKFWDELMQWYGQDLRANAGSLKTLNDAIEAGRKAGTKSLKTGKKKKKKVPPAKRSDDKSDGPPASGESGAKPWEHGAAKGEAKFSLPSLFDDEPVPAEAPVATPPQAPPADLHAKATKLAKKLSRHARTGRVGADALRDGLKKLHKFGAGHLETAARCLGLGGPLGGKAGSKRGAIKRITAHLKTHAKAAAAELHAAAGLDPEPRATLVSFDGLPRTRGWVSASLLAAGVPAERAESLAAGAAEFNLAVV